MLSKKRYNKETKCISKLKPSLYESPDAYLGHFSCATFSFVLGKFHFSLAIHINYKEIQQDNDCISFQAYVSGITVEALSCTSF